ncbi:MAG: hypothetical protein IIA89_14390, partial [Chloroflexi bacterium]|nr:hypothetical protein [Chloroflexota bacterium]
MDEITRPSRVRRVPRVRRRHPFRSTLWLGLVMIPVICGITFAAAAYAVAPMVRPTPQTQVVALTLINAYLVVGGILAVARMLLAPAVKTLRILPLTDVTANYLFIWVRRWVGFS